MPKITVLPHEEYCPQGVELTAAAGDNILLVLLANNIAIEHACEMQCACTTCHIYIRKSYDSLTAAEEKEDDMLDQAWGLDLDSRLSCQLQMSDEDITIEIPKYTLNQVAEGH